MHHAHGKVEGTLHLNYDSHSNSNNEIIVYEANHICKSLMPIMRLQLNFFSF